uniref:BHLH domain-containing protein n=1 Tax=Opuntia streptacantha TaxID=393608 RepID=A0A7C9FBS2_OPUST
MFPFHQRGELSFQISNYLENTSNSNSNSSNNDNNNTSNIVCFDPIRVEQNESAPTTTHLHPVVVQHERPASNGVRRGRPRRPAPSIEVSNNNGDQVGNDVSQKRVVHREIERQRRQEMANLFSSLRSLLPMEYIRVYVDGDEVFRESGRHVIT